MNFEAHDIELALAHVTAREVKTAEDDSAAFPRLETFNDGAVYVGRFSGQSPWERHAQGDELLHVLDGCVEVTLLIGATRVVRRVLPGSVVVVPKGVWHRQLALPSVTLLAVTPDFSENSTADEPPV
jgi:quercetin dioxygenase-like cupin family protein